MSDEHGRILQIFRDGRRHEVKHLIQLPTGAQANERTLAEMAKIVREDAAQTDLKTFIRREILGFENNTVKGQIETAFKFCRDQIKYLDEQDGYETIADLWSCLYALNPDSPVGDCAIKSTALATILGVVGVKAQFVAIKQILNADYYNHVYLKITQDGDEIALDPTQEDFNVGDEVDGFAKLNFLIYR